MVCWEKVHTLEAAERACVNVFGEGTRVFPVSEAVCVAFGVAADLIALLGLIYLEHVWEIAYHCHEREAKQHKDKKHLSGGPAQH